MSSGGWITGPIDAGSVEAKLKGCSVHPKPHPRKILPDCDGEWIISSSAVAMNRHFLDRIVGINDANAG